MDSKLFWGVVIIFIGVSLIVNYLFKIDLPIFKILFALLIIYIGVKILLGSFNFKSSSYEDDRSGVFTKTEMTPESLSKKDEFSIVFGNSKIDLRNTQFESGTKLEMNAVFGSMDVKLPPDVFVSLEASSVFGSVRGAERSIDGIGEQESEWGDASKGRHLRIKANAVFGNVRLR